MLKLLRALFGVRRIGDERAPTVPPSLPFEVVVVPGLEAVAARRALLARRGVTPVIVGSEGDVALMVEGLSTDHGMVQAVLDEANRLDLDAWMEEKRREEPDLYTVPPGAWPVHTAPPRELSVPLEVLTRKPKHQVMIALFATARPWEVPASVRYGGWNACPPPAVHVALHQRWSSRWGARIACMSSEVIECEVAHPPRKRDEALALAREQMAYCPDIVHQGTQSLEGLAATLMGARTWYFWWD